MARAYMRSAYGNLSPTAHLHAVTSLNTSQLKLACEKFNYVAEETGSKGQKDNMITYITSTLKINNTDVLAQKINADPTLLDQLTDHAWRLMVEPIAANQIIPYTAMVDPTTAITNGPMLSHTAGGFRKLGVAFRGDNRSFDEFGTEGFVARYSVQPPSRFHVPEVQGTVVASSMCYDRQNRDFLNQTGVCVARNLVGSMKFISDSKAGSHLFAVQVTTGVDTEAYQQSIGGTSLWRPGEKAALNIPKHQFLASIQCQTTEKDSNVDRTATAVWFKYRFLSDWKFHANVDVARRAHIMNSTAGRKIGEWYDFQRGDDFAL